MKYVLNMFNDNYILWIHHVGVDIFHYIQNISLQKWLFI